jgi:hypothetical protein
LTPIDCDLRDFAFMPLDVVRLRDSDLAAVPDAEVFRAAVLAWCASWHQIPAASLPDDDAVLARLLGYGRDVKSWMKLREAGALRGFRKCSDGRLYHPVVAEKAIDAWEAKKAQRDRTRKAREARLSRGQQQSKSQDQSQQTSQPLSQNGETSVTEPVTDDVTGSKGQGQGQGESSVPNGTGASAPVELFPKDPPAERPKPKSEPDLTVIPLNLVAVTDPGKAVFSHGVAFVRRLTGKPEDAVRRMIGKWRQQLRNDDRRLWGLFVAADAVPGGVADLASWIGARLREGPPASAKSSEPDDGLNPTARAIIDELKATKGAA